jgi:hypothetical protein
MVIVGFLFLIAGTAAGIRSGLLESRAAQGQHIKLWGLDPGPSRTKRSIAWQLTGLLSVFIGGVLLLFAWDIYPGFLVLPPSLAAVVVVVRHNHSVAKREPKA